MLGFTSHNKRCIINKSAPEIPTLLCKCSDCLMHAVHRSVLSKTGKKAVLHISYNQLATVMSKILSSSTQRIILPVRAEYLKILQTYEVLRHRLIPGPGNRNWWSIAWSPQNSSTRQMHFQLPGLSTIIIQSVTMVIAQVKVLGLFFFQSYRSLLAINTKNKSNVLMFMARNNGICKVSAVR